MASQPPGGVWQTAGRQRQSQSSSRTPQNRSGTASPSQQNPTAQPPRQEAARPVQPANNAWTQRSSSASASGSNGQARSEPAASEDSTRCVNGFNATEVKAFLSRDIASVETYKPAEAAGGQRAWGTKPNTMANSQPFLPQLAKQVATSTVEGEAARVFTHFEHRQTAPC